MAIFVNLLLFNELAPELLPIDRKRTDPKVGLRHSLYYRYQPDLRILTRSTGSSPPRDITSRRLVHPSFPHPKLDSPNDRRELLGASFIPVFSGYLRDRPRAEAWAFAQKVFWDMAVVLAVIAALGRCIFEASHLRFHGFWWGDGAVGSGNLSEPHHFSGGLLHRPGGVAAAILNSFHVFGLPAATPIFFNLIFIVFSFGILYRPVLRWAPAAYQTPAVALAIGILVGGAVQLAMQIPALVRLGMPMGVSAVAFSDPGRAQGRTIAAAELLRHERVPDQHVGGHHFRDIVPHAVGQHHVALYRGPRDATGAGELRDRDVHGAAADDVAPGRRRAIFDEMKHTFGFSLRIVSFITIPAAVGLVLLREPIIQVLFQHGQFVADSTALTAHALFYYSLGLPAFAAIKLITPMYYSTQDTMTPARVGAWALGMNIVLNAIFLLFFFRYLSNGSPALASSITAYFNFRFAVFPFSQAIRAAWERAAWWRRWRRWRFAPSPWRQWHTRRLIFAFSGDPACPCAGGHAGG